MKKMSVTMKMVVRAVAARADRRCPKSKRREGSLRKGRGTRVREALKVEGLRFVRSRLAPEVEGTDDDCEGMRDKAIRR